MQHGNKPLAPFGAILAQFLKYNLKLKTTIYVFVGVHAWKDSRGMLECGLLALCLPPNAKIDDFEWPVIGQKLILFDTGQFTADGMRKAAFSLMKQGATQVVLHSTALQLLEIY